MKGLFISARSSRGFTLLEVMIAVAILAVGLLAVARFQAGLLSSSASSKARTEAIAIAQDVADKLRSYEDELTLLDNLEPDQNHDASGSTDTFPDSLTDNYTYNVPGTVEGTNADYTVNWNNDANGTAYDVNITVTWTDPKTGAQSISLLTTLTWHDPVAGALAAIVDSGEPIRPTGKATYSDETHTKDDDSDGILDIFQDGSSEKNPDGLTYTHQEGLDIQLVDLSGKVVLSLEDACNVGNDLTSCTDFVRIEGRVFFDDESSFIDTLGYLDVGVAVNDTAFCSYDNNVTFDIEDADGVDYSSTNPRITDGGNYRFFNYTCYVGGGWYGNVSPVVNQSSFSHTYHICVGDPYSNNELPQVTSRRVYRGMVYKINDDGNAIDANGDVIPVGSPQDYSDHILGSIGVADALQLPNENDADTTNNNGDLDEYLELSGTANDIYITEEGDASGNGDGYLPGHNYVITADDCDTAMTRTGVEITIATNSTHSDADASGNLTVNPFSNSPDDFYCLNIVQTDASGNVYWYDSTDSRLSLATHALDTPKCPYDPTEGINTVSVVSGSIFVEAEDASLEDFVINTSDDTFSGIAGNCAVVYEGSVTLSYDSDTPSDSVTDLGVGGDDLGVLGHYICYVYYYLAANDPDADNNADPGGWEGSVYMSEPSGVLCENPGISLYADGDTDTRITADTGNHDGTVDSPLDFVCHGNTNAEADIETVITVTSSDDDDSNPESGDSLTMRITVTNNGPDTATNVVLTDINTAYSNMTLGTPVASEGTYSSGTWTIGSMDVGDSETLTLPFTVTGTGGQRATLNLPDPAEGDQRDYFANDTLLMEVPITIDGESDVVTTMKLVSPTTPVQGDELTYELTVTNNGPLTDGIWVDGITDGAPTVLSNIDGGGSIQNLACYGGSWYAGSLDEGESATLTITADLDADAAVGTYDWNVEPWDQLSVYVSADASIVLPECTQTYGHYDTITTDDVRTASFTIGAATDADLVVTLERTDGASTVSVDDTVTLTLTLTNNGPATSENITDIELDGVEDFEITPFGALVIDSIVGSAGTGGGQAQKDFSFNDLAKNASHTVTITATVQSAADGQTVSVELLDAPAGDSDPDSTNNANDDVGEEPLTTTFNVATNKLTLSGTITDYNSTAGGTVDEMSIYEADLSNNVSASDGVCALYSGGTEYICTITITEGSTGGVVLQLGSTTSNDDFCDYDAKIQNGAVSWNANSANATWLNGVIIPGDAAQNLVYAGNNDCP